MIGSRENCCLAFVLLLLAATGCSDRLPTFPVTGKVQFTTGGPVHVGTVELKSREHGVQARGQIQPNGSFTLTTYEDGDGAVAGVHDCVVVQLVMAEEIKGHQASTIGVVDRRFSRYATSGLTVEISPDKSNNVVVEVEGVLRTQPDEHTHDE